MKSNLKKYSTVIENCKPKSVAHSIKLRITTTLILWASLSIAETNHDFQIFLGLKYLHGAPPDIERDVDTARDFFFPAATANDPIAQFFLSKTYDPECFGKVPQCDHEKWLRRAAENGEPTAELLLGLRLFELGKINHLRAIEWVGKSVQQGNRSAQIEMGRLVMESVENASLGEELLEACESFRAYLPVIEKDVLSDMISAQCNFISYNQAIDSIFSRSEKGSAGASLFIGVLFEDLEEEAKALEYYRLATEQLTDAAPSTYLENQIALNIVDHRKEAARLETLFVLKEKSKRASRLDRLLAQQNKIDSGYRSNPQTYEQPEPDKPLVRFLKRAAHITLYALATGLASAAEDYATGGLQANQVDYQRSSSGNYSDFAKPSNSIPAIDFNGRYSPDSARHNAPSCRCACVDGQKVSLCTSAVAVPAICPGACPASPQMYQSPSPRPPPPGTSGCFNKSVYNEVAKRYEIKVVCE